METNGSGIRPMTSVKKERDRDSGTSLKNGRKKRDGGGTRREKSGGGINRTMRKMACDSRY